MILNNSDNGGNAKGAVDYMLSMHDSNGNLRAVAPKILRGNPELTIKICEDFCSKFEEKSTFGVLAFRDNEQITEAQKQKLMDDFEEKIFGNMKDKVNILWVEHMDKSNLELHYLVNKVVLDGPKAGNAYNPFPPSANTLKLMKSFSAVKNHEFGFEQVEEKSLKTELTSNELKCLGKEKHGIRHLDKKVEIDKELTSLVENGTLKNRGELIDYLKNHSVKIERITESSISIEGTNGKNIRLSGGIYHKNLGENYDITKLAIQSKKEDFDIIKTNAQLDKLVQKRDDYNEKRFLTEIVKAPKAVKEQVVKEKITIEKMVTVVNLRIGFSDKDEAKEIAREHGCALFFIKDRKIWELHTAKEIPAELKQYVIPGTERKELSEFKVDKIDRAKFSKLGKGAVRPGHGSKAPQDKPSELSKSQSSMPVSPLSEDSRKSVDTHAIQGNTQPQATDSKPSSRSGSQPPAGSSSASPNLISALMALDRAVAKLATAKTVAETVRINFEIALARQKIEEIQNNERIRKEMEAKKFRV